MTMQTNDQALAVAIVNVMKASTMEEKLVTLKALDMALEAVTIDERWNMDQRHLAWAQQHDWYVDHRWNGGKVVIYARKEETKGLDIFNHFADLREFAGY